MKTRYTLVVGIVLSTWLAMVACGPKGASESTSNPGEEVEVPSLEGEWVNISMKVEVASEPDTVVDVPAGKWEEALGIKPILTTFKKDSSFVSEYRNLGDSLFMTSSGIWWISGDSLYMEEHGVLNNYHFRLSNDTVRFTGYIDWDQDGQPDDLYYGEQVRPGR